jgi:hypothetical protein
VQSVNTDILALVKDIQDRVREVAYLMWESAGRQHGMALEYWLSAEREVITTMQAASDRMMPAPVRDGEEAPPDAAAVSQASDRVVAATAANAISAPDEGPAADASDDPVPASQASEAVVEATAEAAQDAAAAGATAAAAKAAAKPTRKAGRKRTPPQAS